MLLCNCDNALKQNLYEITKEDLLDEKSVINCSLCNGSRRHA